MTHSRQLAAIMFTDIEGYTSLMQQNEAKAIQAREKHRRIFNSITAKHHGRILQYYGDGTLSIFNSAIEAVNCAIEMQLGFQQEPKIPVRIGIHTGDIIFSEEEVIGDGVNVASRIESLSLAGSVFISDKVYDEIKNQESVQTSKLKTFKLKNVDKPITVYAISNEGLIVPKLEDIKGVTSSATVSLSEQQQSSGMQNKIYLGIAVAAIIVLLIVVYVNYGTNRDQSNNLEEKSIAVLAFENMSGDSEQEYFSDGISEEILNSLANVQGLKVAGRTSAFSFKGKNEDIRDIGDKLNVKMVLEGSVRKFGNQVRVTAQLINVDDGFHLWSETYERELEDIFAVQQEIANRIVEKLKLQINTNTNNQSATKNPEAYELFLKGSYFFNKGYEYKTRAMEYFEKAIAMDPDYAEAHAYIGETFLHYAGLEIMTTAEAYTKARTSAQRAINLNEREQRAHKVLAYIHLFFDWDWEATLTDYNKAIEFGLSEQNEFISYYDIFVNKDYDNAIHVSRQILETDPLSAANHWHLGICNYFAGRFQDALISFNNSIELDSGYSEGHHWKGVSLGYLGRFDEAKDALDKARELTQSITLPNFDQYVIQIQMGEKDKVMKEFDPEVFTEPVNAAMIYTLLGMPDEAAKWLEKAYRERSLMMVTIKHGWFWDPIRNHPGFIEVYNKMNFTLK